MEVYKILCVGPQWRGSNAGGLFRAFSRLGHLISVVDENYYINLSNKSKLTKVIDRVFRKQHFKEFNNAVLREAEIFNPDIILIYKGAFVYPETIKTLKQKGKPLVNFYPDVSFRTHGSLLAHTLPLYDHVFTTKTFGINDMKEQLGVMSSSFIPHGYDPDIHRILDINNTLADAFKCDVSFIGTYSPKKEQMLNYIKTQLPGINMFIWGAGWHQSTTASLKTSIKGRPITGDLYVMGIAASKINLGILSEEVGGASSGDKITSRTFHIPASGGFMIHEKTEESVLYFKENEETVFYSDKDDLVDKIRFYLKNEAERERIRLKGRERCLNEHSLDHRATKVLNEIAKLNLK